MPADLKPLEAQLYLQIKTRLLETGLTQTELGNRLIPEAKRPASTINQTLNGATGRIPGLLLRILEELGAETIEIRWKTATPPARQGKSQTPEGNCRG